MLVTIVVKSIPHILLAHTTSFKSDNRFERSIERLNSGKGFPKLLKK